jgi:hypothetical protein
MNVSRNFMVVGSLYLIVGICLGMYMGATQDHTFLPLHAHINLLGFTLMTVFGLVYRQFPAMAGSSLAAVHFWLHLAGSLVLVVMLYLLFSETITEAAMFPVAPIAELAVLLGILGFAWNLWQNGK